MMRMRNKTSCKLIALGSSGVGKTQIVYTFKTGVFIPDREPTTGCDSVIKIIELDETDIEFQLWDTPGSERFRSMVAMRSYFRNANVVLLVYDVSKQRTFDELENIFIEVCDIIDDNALVVIVGNKIDLAEEREVNMRMASEYAAKNDFLYIETSCLSQNTLENLFLTIAQVFLQRHKIVEKDEDIIRNIAINNDNNSKKNKKKGCCN